MREETYYISEGSAFLEKAGQDDDWTFKRVVASLN